MISCRVRVCACLLPAWLVFFFLLPLCHLLSLHALPWDRVRASRLRVSAARARSHVAGLGEKLATEEKKASQEAENDGAVV